jgi:hypothetical protein
MRTTGISRTAPKPYRRTIGDLVATNEKKKTTNPCLRPFCRDCPPPPPPAPPGLLLFCSAVGDESSSESEASFDGAESIAGATGGGSPLWSAAGIRERFSFEGLLRASNFASALCVLDCTVLPLVTFLLPLLGLVSMSPARTEWLHELGHRIALCFVVPVGATATAANYWRHRRARIAAPGVAGLLCVLAANAGCTVSHHARHLLLPGGALLGRVLHRVAHHGAAHRLVNLAGCALLVTSNVLSRRQEGCAHGPACDHEH